MKLTRCLCTLLLWWSILTTCSLGVSASERSVPEQLHNVPNVVSAWPGGAKPPASGQADVWADWLWPLERRRSPHRNPLHHQRRLLRLLAQQERKARARQEHPWQGDEAAALPSPAPTQPTVTPSEVSPSPALVSSPVVVTPVPEQASEPNLPTNVLPPEGCSPPAELAPCTLAQKRGRRPTIPTDHIPCPEETCRGYRRLAPDPLHHIVGAGTYRTASGAKRQMFRCELCHSRFSEMAGTVFYGLKTSPEKICLALALLAEGLNLRATARVLKVEVDTILLWLRRAGEHSETVNAYLMRDLHVDQVQLDELWTFVYKKEKQLSAWESLHTEYGDTWIWTVFDPAHKLVLAVLIGDHEEEQAEGVLARLKACLAEACLPLLMSDQLPHYARCILQVFGHWIQPQRRGTRGRFPKPKLEAPEGLQYATVHKERRGGHVVKVTTQVVYGHAQEIVARLRVSGLAQKINTSFVERMNLTLRHLVSRLRRRGLCFSKKRQYLVWHVGWALSYYHFVRPHGSLRRQLEQVIPTRGQGSPKKWEKRTPAMSAGLTDHVWDVKEWCLFRAPCVTPP